MERDYNNMGRNGQGRPDDRGPSPEVSRTSDKQMRDRLRKGDRMESAGRRTELNRYRENDLYERQSI